MENEKVKNKKGNMKKCKKGRSTLKNNVKLTQKHSIMNTLNRFIHVCTNS